jgi:hypothetical protein
MFDNLREESTKDFEEQAKYQPAAGTRSGRKSKRFLGMTPMQRFVIVLLVSMTTCVIGMLCLLATQRVMF